MLDFRPNPHLFAPATNPRITPPRRPQPQAGPRRLRLWRGDTPESFRQACKQFFPIEPMLPPSPQAAEAAEKPPSQRNRPPHRKPKRRRPSPPLHRRLPRCSPPGGGGPAKPGGRSARGGGRLGRLQRRRHADPRHRAELRPEVIRLLQAQPAVHENRAVRGEARQARPDLGPLAAVLVQPAG